MIHDIGDGESDGISINVYPVQQSRVIQEIVADLEETDHGAPLEEVLDRAEENGCDRAEGKKEIERLQMWGALYEPRENMLRVT